MKKILLIVSMTGIFLFGNLNSAISQEQPKTKKDTVNIDSDAKPTFYYAVEDEAATSKSGSNTAMIAIVAGVVVIVAAGGFFLLKKKKK
jgi:LPXTG-motif cell wall-anchored protein